MLRIVGYYASPPPGKLEVMVDATPLQFRTEGSAYCTWELSRIPVHGSTSLLTVGVDIDGGALRDVSVVLLGGRLRSDVRYGPQEVPELPEIDVTPAYRNARQVVGLPIIDVSEFEAYSLELNPPVITEEGSPSLMAEGRNVYVAFSRVIPPDICYRVELTRFGGRSTVRQVRPLGSANGTSSRTRLD